MQDITPYGIDVSYEADKVSEGEHLRETGEGTEPDPWG